MNGILLIDKPAGISSAEVVRRVKRRLKEIAGPPLKPARVGHLGTLDPLATGVLPILIGEATKLAPFLESASKEYEGIIRLGIETDTLDREGVEVRRAAVPGLDAALLDEIAARFTGQIVQTPPVYSAIKRGGVSLYKLARRGVDVEPPPPRTVLIERLRLCRDPADPAAVGLAVVCSPGTYVRSLARDLGLALGTVAHLEALRRVRNGAFRVADARSLETALEALGKGDCGGLIGLSEALAAMPAVQASEGMTARIRSGDARALDGLAPAGATLFKVVENDRLLAVARVVSRMTAEIVRGFDE